MSGSYDSPEVRVFASALAGVRVLAVDDTPDTLELLAMLFELNGASVVPADSADSARELYARERPDLIVSDIMMPGETGIELIRSLREIERRSSMGPVPAIALTGMAREGRHESIAAGFDEHLSKPIEPHLLVKTAVRLLARRA